MPAFRRCPLRQALAVTAVAIGGVIVLLGVFGGGTPRDVLIGALLGGSFLLPGLWWFNRESVDRSSAAAHEEHIRRNLGATMPLPPVPVDRHWVLIMLLSVASFLLGGIIAS